MHKKVIQFQPGKITLYDKKTDNFFSGSLLLKAEENVVAEIKEVKSELKVGFKKRVDQVFAQSANLKIKASDFENFKLSKPKLNIKLPDFSKHTNSLVEFLSGNTYKVLKKMENLSDKLFYSNTPPSYEYLKLPSLSFPLPTSQTAFKGLAIACLLIGFLSMASILLPLTTAKINSMNAKALAEERQRIEQKIKEAQQAQIRAFEIDPNKQQLIPDEFKLYIPKIGLDSDISPSVNLDSEEDYKRELLTTGVAHAKGSYLPGQKGSVFLFAHSTDTIFNIAQFNAKFFSLGDLEAGDTIDILYGGKNYKYKVTDKVIVNPEEVDTIRESGDALILMTCTPPGTDWQRLVIFADQLLQ